MFDALLRTYTSLFVPKRDVPKKVGENKQPSFRRARTPERKQSTDQISHTVESGRFAVPNKPGLTINEQRTEIANVVQQAKEYASMMSEALGAPVTPPTPDWVDERNYSIPSAPVLEDRPIVGVELPQVERPRFGQFLARWFDQGDREAATRVVQEVYSSDPEGLGGDTRLKYSLGFIGEIKARLFGSHVCRHRAARRVFVTVLPKLRLLLDCLRADNSMAVLADTSPAGVQYVETAVRRLLRQKVEEGVIRDAQRATFQRLLVRLAPLVVDEEEFANVVGSIVARGAGY